MVEFDKIWEFVEGKLKTTVPTYFKNILKVCGYNNGITIASIVQNDLSYFVEEVRSGNITKYFGEIDPKEIFEGSTKTEENFEFTRGHEKFLMSIVDLLKKHLDENGPDSFTLESKPEAAPKIKPVRESKKLEQKIGLVARKERNLSNLGTAIKNSEAHLSDDYKKQHGILICKTMMSLINDVPDMYVKNIAMINEKIARDLIKLDTIAESKDQRKSLDLPVDKSDVEKFKNKAVEDSIKYTAQITCPFCKASIRVFHVPGPSGQLIWKTSNFGRHLKNVHSNKTDIPFEKPVTITSKADETADIVNIHVDEIMKTSIEKPAKITSKTHETSENDFETSDIDEMMKKFVAGSSNASKSNETVLLPIGEMVNDDELNAIGVPIVSYQESNEEEASIKSNKEIECSTFNAGEANQKQDKNSDTICLKQGDFVICTLTIKNSVKWPSNTPVKKNVVGRVLKLEAINRKNMKTAADCELEEIELQILKKSPYSKTIFVDTEILNVNFISKNKIVKILQAPSQNRRGEFVFKDKSLLDYIF